MVAGAGSSSGSGAFLWTQAGGYELLDALPGGNSALAVDINEAGQSVGLSSSSTGTRAVRWARDGKIGVQFGLLGARETHVITEIAKRDSQV